MKKVRVRRQIRRIFRSEEWIRLRLVQKNHKASGTTNNTNIHVNDESFVAKLRLTSLNWSGSKPNNSIKTFMAVDASSIVQG